MLSTPSRVFNGFDGMEILTTGSLSKLTFFNVSDADYGNYTCIAINKLGSSNTSFLLYGKKRLVRHSQLNCECHVFNRKNNKQNAHND